MENALLMDMEMDSFDGFEDHFDLDYEDDAFWDDLKSWAGRTLKRIRTPGTTERKWTIGVGKGLMTGGGGLVGFGLAGPPGGIIGSALGGTVAHGLAPDRFMDEDDFMLEELGELAAEAETDEDAVAYVRAMIPVAIRTTRGPKTELRINAPAITRVSRNIVRTLRSRRKTRPLVRVLPYVIKRGVKKLQKKAITGKKISPAATKRVLKSQIKKTYGSSKRSAKLLGRNYALCKYYRKLKRRRPKIRKARYLRRRAI